jgi:exosome complex component RRP4
MAQLVVPGQPITSEAGFLRGHGCYLVENENDASDTSSAVLKASVAGQIERVNRLISVRSLNSRYRGEIGDLVIGRVVAVDSKRWRVDIAGQKEAVLQLSSITLPGGVQRMRTYEDQLQMRSLFEVGDLISAEIQNINSEGVVFLHSRSLKYGKLENGQFVSVPPNLIKRLPQHYLSLPCKMDIILGKNGYLWLSRTIPEAWQEEAGHVDELTPLAETLQNIKVRHAQTPFTIEERLKAARLCNCIKVLATAGSPVTPEHLMMVYQRSVDIGLQPKDLLSEDAVAKLTQAVS